MALILLLASAGLHAAWNLLLKRSEDRAAFLWWSHAVAAVALLPIVLASADWRLPRTTWPVLLVSGLAEAGYVIDLARAYDAAELSVVYPVSRGAAPLLVVIGGALALDERLPLLGYAGVLAVAAGVFLTAAPSRSEWTRAFRGHRAGALGLSLLTAAFIAAYTVADRAGLRHVDPIVWTLGVFIAMELLLAPYFLAGRRRDATLAEWRRRPGLAALAGVLVLGTGLLVMAALALTSASYVGAVRAISVVFAAALGWLVLDEDWGARRLAASIVVFVGVACLSLAAL